MRPVQGCGDTAPPLKKRKLCSYAGPEPSVEEIEAEFWRIVESPDEVRMPAAPCIGLPICIMLVAPS